MLQELAPAQKSVAKGVSQILVVLPAYNEADALPTLISRFEAVWAQYSLNMRVIVVNDGSSDQTAERVRELESASPMPIQLVDLKKNQGLANAVRTGFAEALQQAASDDDIILVMDADDTHPPELMPRMLSHIGEGADVVIASRYQPGARIRGLTMSRVLFSLGASALFQVAVGIEGVRDYTCGYRAYKVGLLRRAMAMHRGSLIKESGFGVMAEILLKLKALDPIVVEVPIILRYDRKQGESKMNVSRTIFQTLNLLARHAFKA